VNPSNASLPPTLWEGRRSRGPLLWCSEAAANRPFPGRPFRGRLRAYSRSSATAC